MISQDYCQCFIIIGAFLAVMGFGAWIGLNGVAHYVSDSQTLAVNTKQQCLIVDYEAVECTYSCSENNDNIQCTGSTYQYTAIVETKCLNESLIGFDADCPADLRDIGEEHTCYVSDCESEFDLVYSGGIRWQTWGLMVIGIFVISIMPCLCICDALKDLFNKTMHYRKYGKWPDW